MVELAVNASSGIGLGSCKQSAQHFEKRLAGLHVSGLFLIDLTSQGTDQDVSQNRGLRIVLALTL